MFLATQRVKHCLIPAVNLASGNLEHLDLTDITVQATQPDEIEDCQYSTYINLNNTPYLVQSIDLTDAPKQNTPKP